MAKFDKKRFEEREAKALKGECPDCGSKLEIVPARDMHTAYGEHDWARKCPAPECDFYCYAGEGEENQAPKPRPVRRIHNAT